MGSQQRRRLARFVISREPYWWSRYASDWVPDLDFEKCTFSLLLSERAQKVARAIGGTVYEIVLEKIVPEEVTRRVARERRRRIRAYRRLDIDRSRVQDAKSEVPMAAKKKTAKKTARKTKTAKGGAARISKPKKSGAKKRTANKS